MSVSARASKNAAAISPEVLEAQVVEPIQLFAAAAGKEARCEDLPERRVVLSPRDPGQVDDGAVGRLRRRRSPLECTVGVATIEDQSGDALRVFDGVADGCSRTL